MATYLMFGKYSAKSIKGISAERTGEASALLQKYGGEMKSGYVLLGEYDLVLIVDLPDTEQAVK
ncbi:GYD domain-containing protein, partial [Chloroflexota bacterium]